MNKYKIKGVKKLEQICIPEVEQAAKKIKNKRIDIYSIKLVKEKSVNYDISSGISTPQKAYEMIESIMQLSKEVKEHFIILCLNVKNSICGIHTISVGTVNASLVRPREVFQAALLNNAASIICFHNHPSGDPQVSCEDVNITRCLADAGKLMNITVLDHIVVGENRYLSMMEEGMF